MVEGLEQPANDVREGAIPCRGRKRRLICSDEKRKKRVYSFFKPNIVKLGASDVSVIRASNELAGRPEFESQCGWA